MTLLFQHEVETLKGRTLSLAARVEDSLRRALRSVRDRDLDLADRVIQGDAEIDRMEVALEEECLKVLALHQPVAGDLRLIIAVIKLTNDLERIADLATDIAERAQFLARRDPVRLPSDLMTMADRVQVMLKKSIDSLVGGDEALARDVCASDDEVDALHRRMFALVQADMRDHPARVEDLMPVLSISRYLERVADHATNIAEDVIYLVRGEIVRHARAPGD